MRFALSVLAAALVVAAGTGCSEDKQSASTPTGSTPVATTTTTAGVPRPKPNAHQTRWAKQVDDVCKPWQERIDAVSPQPTDTASLEAWLEKTLPLVRQQIASVKAVKRPAKADEARKVTLFLGSLQKTEAELTRYLAAIKANAPAKVRRALAEAGAAGAAARAYAVSLDVTQCGGYSSG